MNPDKSLLKMGLTGNMGEAFDGMLEEAEKDVLRNQGAQAALKSAFTNINSVQAAIERELKEEGLVDGDTAKYAKRQVARCMGSIQNMMLTAESNEKVAQGRILGLRQVVSYTQKIHSEEAGKYKSYQDGVASGEIDPEAGGAPSTEVGSGRVVLSAQAELDERRAEAKKAKESAAETDSAADSTVESKLKGKPKTKKRRTKKDDGKNSG